ncbi:hypothetical protein, partial [Salmonella sp. S146_54837]|uniref:hypothetical protein n=1 Tax=Salmonella sp. S146_54837 TaxID=2665635 RepID=UPI00165A003A
SSWLEQACQVGNTPRPVVFVNPERSHEYITEISSILTNAVKLSTSKTGPVNIFSSADYNCITGDNKNLIFMEENDAFTLIDESITDQKIENQSYYTNCKTADKLVPKPTVRFCVTNAVDYAKCLATKAVFESTQKLIHIAWGCVIAKTKL